MIGVARIGDLQVGRLRLRHGLCFCEHDLWLACFAPGHSAYLLAHFLQDDPRASLGAPSGWPGPQTQGQVLVVTAVLTIVVEETVMTMMTVMMVTIINNITACPVFYH